ncbi:MAG: methionine synthase [Sphaerochaetaceae bacterium]
MTRTEYLHDLADKKILLLDGAMGTMIQSLPLTQEDFGESDAKCNEVLSLYRPDVIFDIHMAYLEAGADIIETNTFGANEFSLTHYGLQDQTYDLNLAAAEIARAAVEEYELHHPDTYCFVAGVIGPTGKTASFSPSVDDPTYRQYEFDDFVRIYRTQIDALLDGRVDLLLVETVFDTLVAKAAIVAALQVFEEKELSVPIMVSVTFSDSSARTLSGQSLEAFVATMSAYPLFSLGINCSLGSKQMAPLIRKLANICPFKVSAHPNAGLPDREGLYRETSSEMMSNLQPLVDDGCLSIVGGCCGTTPDHIAAIAKILEGKVPRTPIQKTDCLLLSGWEPVEVGAGATFTIVGERTNVAGSKRFNRIIRNQSFNDALAIAKQQVSQGAMVMDICMDDPMIDAEHAMQTFLRLISAEPDLASVPIMIDSSSWNVITVALKEIQGRAIINSISLKDGASAFLEKARYVASMGAAIIVMLFDEKGQAASFNRKCEIAQRSYRLLVDNQIIDPSSIIIDPNVMAIATGIDAHDTYAKDFLDAVRWIKKHLPRVKVSGGISNLSFSFRGNDVFREALHAVFLRLAVDAGLDMAIMNPSAIRDHSYPDSEAEAIIKEAFLLEHHNPLLAREALISLAKTGFARQSKEHGESSSKVKRWRTYEPLARISEAIVLGEEQFLQEDLRLLQDRDAVEIIEGPLMEGMKKVGSLFGEGRLFLPHVVKSARVMKIAVDILTPRLGFDDSFALRQIGTIVLATVQGDVHDIGKNIVALVLRCNNFRVIDLGVMVDAQKILDTCIAENADIVALSGLISPSLVEMAHVCSLFAQQDLKVPVMIGGATTSEEHTAIKLHPLYPGHVVHAGDVSQAVAIALQLVSVNRESFLTAIADRYDSYHSREPLSAATLVGIEHAYAQRIKKIEPAPQPMQLGNVKIRGELDQLVPMINWTMLIKALNIDLTSSDAAKVKADAVALLENPSVKACFEQSIIAIIGIYPARSLDNSIDVFDIKSKQVLCSFRFARSQQIKNSNSFSLSDFIFESEVPNDYIGMFVATAGLKTNELTRVFREKHDEYSALLVSLLADRLVEAFSEYLHRVSLKKIWDYGSLPSIRPAFGFPSSPDHSDKTAVFTLLDASHEIGVRLTENYAMDPSASVCGLYFVGKGVKYGVVGIIGEDQILQIANSTGRDPIRLREVFNHGY